MNHAMRFSKSPAELPPSIGVFMDLRSKANLPGLVNLALNLWKFVICFLSLPSTPVVFCCCAGLGK